MANIQLEAFGEIFNSNIAINKFRNREYSCPFDSRIPKCDKPNRGPIRYGSCIAKVGTNKRIICPRRFYQGNYKVLRDIRDFIWGDKPAKAYDEVGFQKETQEGDKFYYGNMDWIIVPQGDNKDSEFIGVEIQADSTTGTGKFKEGIDDLLSNSLQEHYAFGLNTLASFKGFLPQFIFKGQLFDDWKKPYVAVIQDELWNAFKSKFRIRYREITDYSTETFLFFVYKIELNSITNRYEIQLSNIYTSRWIDFLFAFAVENELLINYDEALSKIRRKISRSHPKITFE